MCMACLFGLDRPLSLDSTHLFAFDSCTHIGIGTSFWGLPEDLWEGILGWKGVIGYCVLLDVRFGGGKGELISKDDGAFLYKSILDSLCSHHEFFLVIVISSLFIRVGDLLCFVTVSLRRGCRSSSGSALGSAFSIAVFPSQDDGSRVSKL